MVQTSSLVAFHEQPRTKGLAENKAGREAEILLNIYSGVRASTDRHKTAASGEKAALSSLMFLHKTVVCVQFFATIC